MDRIDGMRTFVAIVEAGSITAAADILNISKKLASKYLAQLERDVGVALLNRTTRSQSLTLAGQQYYNDCVEIVARVEEAHANLQKAQHQLSGLMRITAPVSFGELVLLPILRKFKQTHHDITFDLRLSDTYLDLTEGGFDFAVRIGDLDDSNLIARRLAETALWTVASPSYLSQFGTPMAPHELVDHHCIRDSNFRGGTRWPFQINGVQRRVAINPHFIVNSATAVRALLLADQGIGLVPDFVVRDDVADGRLVRVLDAYPTLQLPIHAVQGVRKHRPERVRVALQFIRDALKEATPSA
jgi:DNA-binding transcriptional LysR family regulator